MLPMASRLQHFLLLLLVALLLVGASVDSYDVVSAGNVKKVPVALYYESLCPYSAQFLVNYLSKFFEEDLIEAADLALVPYGNAKVGKDGAISCQHGPDECLLNNVEACAIDVWPDLKVHFSFIYCVEDLVIKNTHQEWRSCFNKLGLNPKPFSECFASERAHQLSLKYGKETDALVPPHKYVPWVVVDGQPLYDDYENFEVYVCKAYKGNPPKACQGLIHRRPIVQQVVEAGGGVSYNSGDDLKLDTAEDYVQRPRQD